MEMGTSYSNTYDMYHPHPHPVVAKLDPAKYSGLWYEVARYDTLPYEKGCGDATAFYQWDPNLKVMHITNTCYVNGQAVRSDTGLARIVDQAYPGKLSVTFDINPQYAADYWVHYTDYLNFAIVGGPSNTFLWLLSRRSKIGQRDINFYINWVKYLGYDSSRLVYDANILSNDPQPITYAQPEPLHVGSNFIPPNFTY
jgi:lipocalin